MGKTLKDCLLEGGVKGKVFLHRYYINDEERVGNDNSFTYSVVSLSFIPPNMTKTKDGYREVKKGEIILDQGRLEILREGNKLPEWVGLSRYSDDQIIE